WIMGELYAQGLRNLGYTVDLKTNVGSSDIISAALLSGQIDLYPEYTGVMLVSFMGEDKLMDSAEETYELAQTWAEDNQITMLKATPFENKNAVAVRKEFAEEHTSELKSRLDLVCRLLLEKNNENVNYELNKLKDTKIDNIADI